MRGGQFFVWYVMVAYNEIYAFAVGVVDFLDGLDTAIQDDDQLDAHGSRAVDVVERNAIAIFVSVWDIVIYIRIETI